MLVVALTGNFGMGKSTVLELFRECGAYTLSADDIVAELLEEPSVKERVREIIGDLALDGEGRIDKRLVARIIFMDRHRREAVEEALHPLVFSRIQEALGRARAALAVVEVPLLFERGYEKKFHKSVAVYADYHTVLERMKRKGISREDVMLRHSVQLPTHEKIRRADYAIDNGGTLEETRRQVRQICASLRAASDGGN
ncbi:MAG: dephospho-CoA kinase [Nitrospirota bacterium]|jgi:dephospho-CoA kinase